MRTSSVLSLVLFTRTRHLRVQQRKHYWWHTHTHMHFRIRNVEKRNNFSYYKLWWEFAVFQKLKYIAWENSYNFGKFLQSIIFMSYEPSIIVIIRWTFIISIGGFIYMLQHSGLMSLNKIKTHYDRFWWYIKLATTVILVSFQTSSQCIFCVFHYNNIL